MKLIYLDNNATTRLLDDVYDRMQPFLRDHYANPSSFYRFGSDVRKAVEDSRECVAALLGAESSREIVFTSGATESNNLAICSTIQNGIKKKLITSAVEHSSVRNVCKQLAEKGCPVDVISVTEQGRLNLSELEKAVDERTALVSLMWANNETGVIFPLKEAVSIIKNRNPETLIHVDAVQAAGKIPVNVRAMPIDFASISAHKFHGPKGAGALWIRSGVPLQPISSGGKQERGLRPGTEHVAGIVGLATALSVTTSTLYETSEALQEMRDLLELKLRKFIPDLKINGVLESRISNTTNITIPGIDSEVLLLRLSEMGICASSGSACLTGALEPSHVLLAMGLSESEARQSIRFSLSRFNTVEEIETTVMVLAQLVDELRSLNSENVSRN